MGTCSFWDRLASFFIWLPQIDIFFLPEDIKLFQSALPLTLLVFLPVTARTHTHTPTERSADPLLLYTSSGHTQESTYGPTHFLDIISDHISYFGPSENNIIHKRP